jgi:multidrug resistance protein, MATE family
VFSGAVRNDIRTLLQLALPVIGARILIMTMGVADTIVVGRYAADELAFIAMAWAPTGVLIMAGVGLLGGVQVLAARHAGAGELTKTGAVWRRGCVYGFWLSVFISLPFVLFPVQILKLLGQPPALAEGAGSAMRILAISIPFYAVYVASAFYLEAMKRPVAGLVAMVLANVANVIVNVILVNGAGPLEPMGADGAAWATLLVRVLLGIGMAVFILNCREAAIWGTNAKPPRAPVEEAEQRRIGYANGISQIVEAGAFSGMSVFAGWVSLMAVAAYSIALNVMALMFMVALGLAVATAVLVARGVGANDINAVRRASWIGLALTVLTMTLCLVAVGPGASWIAGVYTANDGAMVSAIVPLIIVACFAIIFDGLQVTAAQALRAQGDVWFPTASHLFSYAAIMLPLGWWLGVHLGRGAAGLMEAIVVASVFSGTILSVRLALRLRGQKLRAYMESQGRKDEFKERANAV